MNKVNETIQMLCDWIQTQLSDGKCDTSHQVSEMVKALAELVSANAAQSSFAACHTVVKNKAGNTLNLTYDSAERRVRVGE